MTVRTRIAPSPTGMPHIGTVFQALLNYAYAKKHSGQFLVRIEDTDRSRFVEGAQVAIFESLAWAGLEPDESPVHGGKYGPYLQSERLELYKDHALKLVEAGHAYYCFCSGERLDQVRKQMQAEGKPPMYDKHCRHLELEAAQEKAKQQPHVIRLKVPEGATLSFTDEIRGEISFDSNVVDDQVLLKSDGFPTYHLAVVVDDHLMEISHVVRGEEWISSTPKHLLLYEYFQWPVPKFIHTPLLRNPDKSKLSKRHGHASVQWYIDQGYLPEAVLNFLASRVWNHPAGLEVYGVDELIKHFDFKDMHIQGPIVDLDKLNWLNGQWLRSLDDTELLNRLQPYLSTQTSSQQLPIILPLIKDRLVKLSDVVNLTSYFFSAPQVEVDKVLKQSKLPTNETKDYLDQVLTTLETMVDWDAAKLETSLRTLQERLALKPRAAFMTLRVALTGETATPPLFDVMAVLGKAETQQRLQAISQQL